MRYMTFKEFYDEKTKKNELKEFAFLFGNGFPMSSPQTVNNIPLRERFIISEDEYTKILEEVDLRVKLYTKKFYKFNGQILCPEKLLNFMRRVYGILIFRNYQDKQEDLTSHHVIRPTDFLKKFKSIYTLNYDFFSYVFIFQPFEKTAFKDGFSNSPICIGCVKDRLEREDKFKPFYSLHGAFHLFLNEDNEYRKIIAGEGATFPENVIHKYKEMDEKLEDFQNGKANLDDPILIFSGRTTYKNAAVSDDEYLKYCLEQLEKESKIFTFGCSFKLDSHILDAIFKNYSEKEIYIGFHNSGDILIIQNYMSEKGIHNRDKITLVNVSENQSADIENTIWNQQSF